MNGHTVLPSHHVGEGFLGASSFLRDAEMRNQHWQEGHEVAPSLQCPCVNRAITLFVGEVYVSPAEGHEPIDDWSGGHRYLQRPVPIRGATVDASFTIDDAGHVGDVDDLGGYADLLWPRGATAPKLDAVAATEKRVDIPGVPVDRTSDLQHCLAFLQAPDDLDRLGCGQVWPLLASLHNHIIQPEEVGQWLP